MNPYPPFPVAGEPSSCDSLPSVSLSQDLPSVWMCVSPQQASSRWGKVDPSTPVCPAVLGPSSQRFSGFSVSVPPPPRPSVFFVSGLPSFLCLWTPTFPLCVSGTPRRIPLFVSIPHSLAVLFYSGPSLFSVRLSHLRWFSPLDPQSSVLGHLPSFTPPPVSPDSYLSVTPPPPQIPGVFTP